MQNRVEQTCGNCSQTIYLAGDEWRHTVSGSLLCVPAVRAANPTTTPPSLTEQAQELAEQMADAISDAAYEGSLTEFLAKSLASFAAEAATQGQVAGIERALKYLDRVRDEAAMAALEQAAQVVRERRKWYDEELFGPLPPVEERSESENRLVTLAAASMARHTCDHLLEEIAAIGDDKE